MTLLSENVIPGNHGKVFGTNAKTDNDLEKIKRVILKLNGVKDVIVENDKFPIEFIVHTSAMVKIEDIEQEVISVGFHAIPKTLFGL